MRSLLLDAVPSHAGEEQTGDDLLAVLDSLSTSLH